jgi:predicted Zn-dependent protease
VKALLLLALLGAENKGDANAAAKAALEQHERFKKAQDEADKACAPLAGQPGSLEKEKALGARLADDLHKKQGAVVTGPVAEYVQKFGADLSKGAKRQELPWTFEVLDNAEPKSGFVPGGRVMVTTGLLAALKNEAQLAAVLLHEIAHVDQHVSERLGKAIHQQCRTMKSMQAAQAGQAGSLPAQMQAASAATDEAMMGAMADMTLMVVFQVGPSAEDETQADAAAAEGLKRLGYARTEFQKVLERVPLQSLTGGKLPTGTDRVAALGNALDKKPGKAPPFPKKLQWPK